MNGATASDIAAALLEKAGIANKPSSIDRLAGGRNNRVFRLDFYDRTPLIIKAYHRDPKDPRDRLSAEWQFLQHAWDLGIRTVPQPLCVIKNQHSALYSFVEGQRAGQADACLVDQALDLVLELNTADSQISLQPAAESCFSIAEHISTIDRRVAILHNLDNSDLNTKGAANLVYNNIEPKWNFVRQRLINEVVARGADINTRVQREIVSPSDFGFHNALIDKAGNASFLDFEYAGWDDPAKLVCDFFCQPEVPVPGELFSRFVRRISTALDLLEEDVWRCAALLDAYRIKWACIMLNEFTELGAKRRGFSNPEDLEVRAQQQIGRVSAMLAQITLSH